MEVSHRQLSTTGEATLRLALAKHIDDLKVIAKPPDVTLFRHTLEAVFGKLKYHEGELKNTGIEHKAFPDGSIEMGQTTYIKGIQPIVSAVLVGKDAEALADETVVGMYRSVLGAVAYTQLTQLHMLVYIVAAQRKTHNPTYLHCRRLNAILRHIKLYPQQLRYVAMKCQRRLVTHSDSGFTKEQEK